MTTRNQASYAFITEFKSAIYKNEEEKWEEKNWTIKK
jgi:hypothetical protein